MRISVTLSATVVAVSLAGCGAASPVTGPTASTTPSPATGARPTPAPTRAFTPVPSATATSPAPACAPQRGGGTERATITDVRAGMVDGRDRIVIELDRAVPEYEIAPNPAGTSFVGSASGLPITVAGAYGVRLQLRNLDMPSRYPHGTDLRPGFAVLEEVRVAGDFEGIADLAIGLSREVCPTVSVLADPSRLVVDFPAG